MQQKGRTEQILERMQELVNNGQGALSPGKIMVPKEEISRLILELNMTVTTELKQYRDITDKRAKVLREAQQKAEDIIYEAEQSASRIRVTGRKTNVAPVRMLDLPETARRSLEDANEIYAASLIYTDEMMAEMQDVIENALLNISANYEYAIADLQQKSEIIAANRAELMADLQSMEKEDRYQQIMEIGQLLSEELYHSRRRAAGEEEYPQMTLNFTENGEQAGAAVSNQQAQGKNNAGQDGDLEPGTKTAESFRRFLEAGKGIPNMTGHKTVEAAQDIEAGQKTAETGKDTETEEKTAEAAKDAETEEKTAEAAKDTEAGEQAAKIAQDIEAGKTAETKQHEAKAEAAEAGQDVTEVGRPAPYSIITSMDEKVQREVAASVASALEEKKKVEVSEITKEVSEAAKREAQPSLSVSVIDAMKRAAKKAVLGLDEEEDDIFADEIDEESYLETFRAPTQPLNAEEIAARAGYSGQEEDMQQPEPDVYGMEEQLTPEELREQRHRAFVEAHKQKVKEEEERWLNAVYEPAIPDPNAVDPIVAMALQERQEAKKTPPADF
ncbi:MAG: hypothetical protein K2G89_01335 [Lachnospiraceae bacterium]|nr:hypothetical protein [Lachnospiraceae bacterium]